MNLSEKLAYIRGLCEGLDLQPDTKESRVLLAMFDLMEDMVEVVTSIDEDVDQIYEEIDAIDADLDDIEEVLFGDGCDCEDCEDCDDDDCDCGHCHGHDDDDDDSLYEFTCPACNESLVVDEETLFNSDFACPSCGLRFDDILDSIADDDEEDDED